MSRLGFRTYPEGDGCFVESGMNEVSTKLDNLLERYEAGQFGHVAMIGKMDEMIASSPNFIEAYVTKGYALSKMNNHAVALDVYAKGVAIGEAAIPKGFGGEIHWSMLENRAFLRALHGQALCLTELGNPDEANEIYKRMLKLNPNDNQGIRSLIAAAPKAA